MAEVFYVIGELMLIAALLGLIGVTVWVVLSALHVKNQTIGHAKRLSQRPLAAGKNLGMTLKGIAQQETIHVKHIGASVMGAVGAVKHSALEIKDAAQTVHTEELRPAIAGIQETGERIGQATKVLRLAAQLSRAAAKQRPR